MQSIGYYQINWGLWYLFAFFFLFRWLFKKFHWSFALAIAYTLLNTYGFGIWTELKQPYAMYTNMTLKIHHEECLIIILLCLFILDYINIGAKWFAYLCATNIIVTICMLPFNIGGFHMVGLSANPAMNAAITAITLPFLFYLPSNLIIVFLTLGAILIFSTGQFTPILALIVAFLGPRFLESEKKVRNATVLIVMASVIFLLIHNKNNVVDRLYHLELFAKYWLHNNDWKHKFNYLIGCGNGSFNFWGPHAEQQTYVTDEMFFNRFMPFFDKKWVNYHNRPHWYWLWLHSDILQTLFEMGTLGLLVWINTVAQAVWRMRKNEAVLASMLAWLTVAVFYFPLHYPIQMMLGVFLISFAIKKEI